MPIRLSSRCTVRLFAFALLPLCAALQALAQTDSQLVFTDEWTYLGEKAFGYQSVPLTARRPEALKSHPEPTGTVRYGTVRLGGAEPVELSLMLDLGVKTEEIPGDIYLDANADGAIAATEKAAFADGVPKIVDNGKKPAGISVSVTASVDGRQVEITRDLAVQIDTFGVVAMVAARGYWSASPGAEGLPENLCLIDKDADGLLGLDGDDGWIADLDGDGGIAQEEVGRLRQVLKVEPRVYDLGLDTAGTHLSVSLRPTTLVQVIPALSVAPGAEVVGVDALLLGDDGSEVRVLKLGEPIEVRVGTYVAAGILARVKDVEGAHWNYALARVDPEAGRVRIAGDDPVEWDLAGDWRLEVLSRATRVQPGEDVPIALRVTSSAGFEIADCSLDPGLPGSVTATVKFLDPNGRLIGQEASGFG